MIALLLRASIDTTLAACGMKGNEKIYCDLPEPYLLLHDVDLYSECSFNSQDMPQILLELRMLREVHASDPAAVRHLDEAAAIATRCRHEEGTFLTFTPFLE